MPAPKKPTERRQRGRSRSDMRTDIATIAPSLPVSAPQPLATWSEAIIDEWRDLWASPLAAHFQATDHAALKRLFTYRARLADAIDRADQCPESAGSTGQLVLSPWIAEIHRLEAAIDKLEDRFGLTPLARLRLGITLEEGVSLAAKNAELMRSFQNAQ